MKYLFAVLVATLSVAVICGCGKKEAQAPIPETAAATNTDSAASSKPLDPMSFASLADHLDLSKHTSLHVENYWQKMLGKEIKWDGLVIDVEGGKGTATVTVAVKEAPTYKGYNAVLVTHNIDDAAALMRGDFITFTGRLNRHSGRKGIPTVITLSEGQIVKRIPKDKVTPEVSGIGAY